MTFAQLVQYAKKGIFTLIGLFLVVYFSVILISHSANDPSWSHISSDMTTITNMGGISGAWLSDIVFTFLGWCAWLIPLIILYETLLIWWERQNTSRTRFLVYAFLLLTGSALSSQFSVINDIKQLGSTKVIAEHGSSMLSHGGIIGYELAARMTMLFTRLGSLLFLLIFFVVTLTFAFDVHWKEIVKQIANRKWLGSGLATEKQQPKHEESDVEEDEEIVDNTEYEFEQLPLDYEKENKQEKYRSETRLKDFIATTGLGAALRKQKQDDLQRLKASQETQSSTTPIEPAYQLDDFDEVDNEPYETEAETKAEQAQVSLPESDNLQSTITSTTLASNTVLDNSTLDNKTLDNRALDNDALGNGGHTSFDSTEVKQIQPMNDVEQQLVDDLEIPTELDSHVSHEADMDLPAYPFETSIEAPETMSVDTDTTASNQAIDTKLPDIHDDAAFAGQSRAMQTAKYRDSLSSIPELSILDKPDPNRKPSYTPQELQKFSELLAIKLQDFSIKAEVVNAIPGPVVTRFEVELAPGVKASKVVNISRDLARSMSMASLRVVEVIPGKPYIGIEVPNKTREMVRLIELLESEKYRDPKGMISMAMGKDIGGRTIITDLAKAPHMLVAGTTGSGKSVLVNSMLLSMLLKYTPEQLRLILIDPKQLELANYNDIPHLLTPVVTDMTEAAGALSWCVQEMERRYQLMSLLRVRKLDEFNKKVKQAEEDGNPILDPLWRPNDSVSIEKAPKLKPLPMIIIVADEFADMIMQVGKQAEELITRLAQKSRASGIHLMLATQRPSVDVITGLIKANIPARAALRVNSKVDSRTILDQGGAEDMLGNGDMLFLGPGQIEPERVHGAFVSDEEVNRVCEAWRERGSPDYITNFSENFQLAQEGNGGSTGATSGEDDALYDEVVAFVMETRKVSASSIQRKFSIGYNRAARIVDSLEQNGIVSAMDKGGKRQLLI